METLYARWMKDWENRLCFRATNRVVRPFDWGLEWTGDWPTAQQNPRNGHTPAEYLRVLNDAVLESSDEFFSYKTPSDFELDGKILRFTSPIKTPYPENNVVHGQWYPAVHKPGQTKGRGTGAAALECVGGPAWSAVRGHGEARHLGAARQPAVSRLPHARRTEARRLRRVGQRRPHHRRDAPGRDRRPRSIDWLEQQGYESIGICGTSLGSCYAFLASTHDQRLKVNVFNHCSTYFADVVWEGLSTQHIRQSLETSVTIEELREAWKAISPPYYIDRYATLGKKTLFIYAKYDTTFPVRFSEQVIEQAHASWDFDHKVVVLPCGHYTQAKRRSNSWTATTSAVF